jgi:hypothetical protein
MKRLQVDGMLKELVKEENKLSEVNGSVENTRQRAATILTNGLLTLADSKK